jgi:hypothetical protein
MWVRVFILMLAAGIISSARAAAGTVLWAWERPEDLRFAGRDVEVAVQSGFVVLSGAGVYARGRRFPLLMFGRPATAMVHIQIDHHRPLAWNPEQRSETTQAVLHLARSIGAKRLQLDFEVRKSERPVLLEVLSDLRREMPKNEVLSMTALASWCETEAWLDQSPADEIVPMLFRMGPGGQVLKAKLEAGGDFANPRCRTALAVSADAPLSRAPAGRRIYLFSPRSWTARDYEAIRERIARWSSAG